MSSPEATDRVAVVRRQLVNAAQPRPRWLATTFTILVVTPPLLVILMFFAGMLGLALFPGPLSARLALFGGAASVLLCGLYCGVPLLLQRLGLDRSGQRARRLLTSLSPEEQLEVVLPTCGNRREVAEQLLRSLRVRETSVTPTPAYTARGDEPAPAEEIR